MFGGSTPPIGLARWSGSEWASVSSSGFNGSFSAGLTARVAKSDLGGTNAFQYAVITIDGKTGELSDRAPDGALGQRWSYALSAPVVDLDKDGVLGTKDKCPRTAAGRYDANTNGCPGPYPAIAARVSYAYILAVRSHSVHRLHGRRGAPAGATPAIVSGPGVTESLKSSGRPVVTARVTKSRFRPGQTITVTVTKPGMVGYVGRFQVNASGLKLVARACTPAAGNQADLV